MKNAIKEYLGFSDAEKKSLLNTAVIVFDTNVFLNLYRYSKLTRDALLGIMATYKDRLWMPHQVANEFMKNRIDVIEDVTVKYGALESDAVKLVDNFRKELRLEKDDKDCEELSAYLKKWLDSKKDENLIVSNYGDDDILNTILDLFDGKVGAGYSAEKLKEIEKEGKERYSRCIPPGYKDSNKAKDGNINNAYGDLIVWKQILDYAKDKKVDIVYVTNEKKPDWWNITKTQKTIGPRVELIREFTEITNQRFHMYQMDLFISFVKNQSEVAVDKKVVDEVQAVASNRHSKNQSVISDNLDFTSQIGRELYELEEINYNRYCSLKGYERIIQNGTATVRQAMQYEQTLKKYNQDEKRIQKLKHDLLRINYLNAENNM